MTASLRSIEAGRVVRVDFPGPRHDEGLHPRQQVHSGGTHPAPQRSGGRATPEPETIAAVAMLIAENAAPATMDDEVDAICQLLRQKCDWSDESLSRLRVATVLVRSQRPLRPIRSAM